MSSKTLDEIRKKLQSMDIRKSGYTKDKSIFEHWNAPEGTTSIIRFLPDGNEDNTFFWTERQVIKLPFPGIKGHDENKEVVVQVPCVEMWDGKMTCPILNEVRPMWKDKSLEDTARKYWVKKAYYSQGFVKQDAVGETETPENPIRKFVIGPQLFKILQASLLDPDMENNPVNYVNGTDFVISKTSKGGFADYGTSKWARKESSLTDDQLAAIKEFGLADLSTYLPKRPTDEQKSAMFDMFEASLAGELYDPVKWSHYFKPFGFDSAPSDDPEGGEGVRTSKPSYSPKPAARPAVVTAPKATEVEDSSVEAPTKELVGETIAPAGKSPQDILKMLRERNKQ